MKIVTEMKGHAFQKFLKNYVLAVKYLQSKNSKVLKICNNSNN